MIDLHEADIVEIHIDWTGQKVWINTDDVCQFRAYRIKKLSIIDDRLQKDGSQDESNM